MIEDNQIMDIEKEFQNCEEKVRHVLENHEKARNDDDLLIWIIKRHIEDADLNTFKEYKKTTNAETIRRNRAKIQNDDDDLLPTDPEVIEKRKLKEQKVREYFMTQGETEALEKFEKHQKQKQEKEEYTEKGVQKIS